MGIWGLVFLFFSGLGFRQRVLVRKGFRVYRRLKGLLQKAGV